MLTTSQEQPSGMPAASPADRIRLPAARPPGHLAASWLGRVLLAAGLGMIPWVVILARALPPAAMAAHWATAWAGLDSLEAIGLVTTGVALTHRCHWLCLPATVTATLLAIDAWFDVTTSAPGPAAMMAAAMAVFPELPMAALCAMLAARSVPRALPPR
jgi:hypothetical protein